MAESSVLVAIGPDRNRSVIGTGELHDLLTFSGSLLLARSENAASAKRSAKHASRCRRYLSVRSLLSSSG
jgi:hypothetical protein